MSTPTRQQGVSRFKESDYLTKEVRPDDFALRPIEDYHSRELETLFNAVAFLRNVDHDGIRLSAQEKQDLDIWCYRLRDAKKEALHREQKS